MPQNKNIDFVAIDFEPEQQEQPVKTWRDRLKEGFSGPVKMPKEISEADAFTAPRFAVPGGSQTPLAEGISEAGAAASLGATSSIGTPKVAGMLRSSPRALREMGAGVREGVAIATKTPENNLRFPVRVVGHGGGALLGRKIGSAAGLGPEGAVLGGIGGAKVLEGLLPNRRTGVTEQLRAPYGGGSASRPKASPSGTAGVQTGRAYPSPQKISPVLEPPVEPVTPAAPYKPYGGGSAKRPGYQPGGETPTYGKSKIDTPRAPSGQGTSAATKPAAAEPPIAGEGRPATWTNERVVELAQQNNPQAIEQVQLRKLTFPNQRYMTGEGSPFSSSMNAIRNRFMKPLIKGNPEGGMLKVGGSNAAAARSNPAPQISTDSMSVKWAETPEGIRVTIPKRVPESEVMQYAQTKLAEQAASQQKIKGSLNQPTNRIGRAVSEAQRLDLGELSSLEQRYVADIMESPEYAQLGDAGKRSLIEDRVIKLGGR